MNHEIFMKALCSVRAGERYYDLVDQIGVEISDQYVSFDDVRSVAQDEFGYLFKKSESTLSKKTFESGMGVVLYLRQLKGGKCEIGLVIDTGNEKFGSNLPDLAFGQMAYVDKKFSRDPPYPRIKCRTKDDVRMSLKFLSALASEMIKACQ